MRLNAIIRAALADLALDESEAGRELLNRLANDVHAVVAWNPLAIKAKGLDSLESLVHAVFNDAIYAIYTLNSEKRDWHSARQIKAAAVQAAKLATQLASLIVAEPNLRPSGFGHSLLSQEVIAANRRILFGLLSTIGVARHDGLVEMSKFAPKVESELDELHKLSSPRSAPPSTPEAYHLQSPRHLLSYPEFVAVLMRFAQFAEKSGEGSPRVPYPGTPRARQQYLGRKLCGRFKDLFGSPSVEICTGLLTAIFEDDSIEADTVKKWWQRRRDN